MRLRRITTLALALALGACAEDPDQVNLDVEEAAEIPPGPVTQPAGEPLEEHAGAATLAVAEHSEHGAHLTDARGRALYLFEADRQGASSSACRDACAEAWPPFISEGQPQLQGAQLDASKIGTIDRGNGQMQVTYGGWPLYYYAKDTRPGMATGHDIEGHGAEWYLVTPAGRKLEH